MKRFLVLSMILGLVFGSMTTAEAKKKKTPKPYTMEATYTQPAIGTAGAGITTEIITFPSNSTHTYVTVEITDDTSPTAHASFSWDTDGDGVSDTGFIVCGATDGSVEVPANTAINVFMWALPGPQCAGFSTSGTIKATFSATP